MDMGIGQGIALGIVGGATVLGTFLTLIKWIGAKEKEKANGREVHDAITERLEQWRDGPCHERSSGIVKQVELTREMLSDKIDDAQKHTKDLIDTQQRFIDKQFKLVLTEIGKRNGGD